MGRAILGVARGTTSGNDRGTDRGTDEVTYNAGSLVRRGRTVAAEFASRATQPSSGLTAHDDRERAHLLASVSFAMAAILTVSAVISTITSILFPDRDTSLGPKGTALIAATAVGFWYALANSRAALYRRGAWLLIITTDVFLTAFVLLYPASANALIIGYAMPILVAAILLGSQGVMRLMIATLVLCVVMLVLRAKSIVDAAYVFAILLVVMILTWVVSVLRDRDLADIKTLRRLELADAERLRSEFRLARTVQLAMIPSELPQVDGLDIAAYSEPALEASGDFYDVFAVTGADGQPGGVAVVVCDVAGHGLASALIMSATRAAVRTETQRLPEPAQVLSRVNQLLADSIPKGLFVTIFLGVVDPTTGVFRFASAGHPHPYHWVDRAGELVELQSYGMPLGLSADVEYEQHEVVLTSGDFVLIYSDGLVEAHNPSRQMYGFDQARSDVEHAARTPGTAASLVDHALMCMQRFAAGEPPDDDVTLLALSMVAARAAPSGGAPEPGLGSWTTTS